MMRAAQVANKIKYYYTVVTIVAMNGTIETDAEALSLHSSEQCIT
jgi:hypothetical protein